MHTAQTCNAGTPPLKTLPLRAGFTLIAAAILLASGCGGGNNNSEISSENLVWSGAAANFTIQVYSEYSNPTAIVKPVAELNYSIEQNSVSDIEIKLSALRTHPLDASHCKPDGLIYHLIFRQNSQEVSYVDDNHAACALPGKMSIAQPIQSSDMQALWELLESQKKAQAQAKIAACKATSPSIHEGIHGCFTWSTDVLQPFTTVTEDVVPNATVTVFPASTPLDISAPPLVQTSSNAMGHYALTLTSGDYLLCASEQPVTGFCTAVAVSSNQVARRDYHAGAGLRWSLN